MSDNKIKDKEDKSPKKLRGFANPANRKHINRSGRPEGSRNTVPSETEFNDLVKKSSAEAIEKVLSIMRKGTESNQLKAAFRVLDATFTVFKTEEDGVKITKKSKDASEDYELTERKATGTEGKVVDFKPMTFLATDYVEEDKK